MIDIGRYDHLFLCPEAGESNRRGGIWLPVRQFTPLSMSFLLTRVVDMDAGWESLSAAPTRPPANVDLGDEAGLFEFFAERGSLVRLGAK